jgi:uncharacterized membrane protein YsdA (DUF1294 family)
MPSPRTVTHFLLPALLVLPGIALLRTGWDWRWLLGYVAVINLLTFGVYAWDKRRARAGGWRVAEFQLHLLELIGGWPAAWVAQRALRHKCTKKRYQVVYWLILIIYQLVALDILLNGLIIRSISG